MYSFQSFPWGRETIASHESPCSYAPLFAPKPSSTGYSSSKQSYSVTFLAVTLSKWSYQTLPFNMMSCLKEMETWVIAGEGDLFEHMVVVIILISLRDCISLVSNLLWKRLQCSRLVLIQASHLLNLFPLSFTVSHVFIHDSLCGFWADAVLHHYKQIIAMLRLNKVSKSNGMVVFLFLFLRG